MLWHPGRQGTADAVSDGPARTAVPPGRPVTGTWDGAPDALLPGLPGPRMRSGWPGRREHCEPAIPASTARALSPRSS
jgi:hypothetical protein